MAAAFRDDADPRLPRVEPGILGTPAYMAPEVVVNFLWLWPPWSPEQPIE